MACTPLWKHEQTMQIKSCVFYEIIKMCSPFYDDILNQTACVVYLLYVWIEGSNPERGYLILRYCQNQIRIVLFAHLQLCYCNICS